MCDPICLQYPTKGTCVNNTCVCAPGNSGYGEGLDFRGSSCVVVEDGLLNPIWLVCLAGSALVVLVCVLLLGRWLKGGNIDNRKLFANRNFKILSGALCSTLFYGIYSLLRLFAGVFAFNDYLGSVVFFVAQSSTLLQCLTLTDLCHATLAALLSALGTVDVLPERSPIITRTVIFMCVVPFIPIVFSPAISPSHREIMVQYYCLMFTTMIVVHMASICWAGERAIKVLRSLETEAAKGPRWKIRLLLLNMYVTGTFFVIAALMIVFTYVVAFAYYVAAYSMIVAWASLPTVCVLNYDPGRIQRTLYQAASPRLSSTDGKEPPA